MIFKNIIAAALISAGGCTGYALTTPAAWPAGEVVTQAEADSLFAHGAFHAVELNGAILNRIEGRSLKRGALIDIKELRYLPVLHKDICGRTLAGELICSESIAADLEAIFRELYALEYPIERMVLIDEYDAIDEASMEANNSSCFNYREIAGSKKLSKHALGRAVDLNPLYNPYVKGNTVSPASAAAYTGRKGKWPYKIERGDAAYRLFKAHGFTWGGDWQSLKDWQHFEK